MIPVVTDFDITTAESLPTHTYGLDPVNNRVQGYKDGQTAMKQAIFKILQTERYKFPKIYSDNYGVELEELIGMPIPYVLPELERRITEALLWDERITTVSDFEFTVNKNDVLVTFTADTIYGTVEVDEWMVSI